MKYSAVAVAMASVAAADSLSTIAWEPVESTSTTWDPKPTSNTWDPKATSTTWTAWDPVTSTSTWTTWDPKPTTTTWTTWDPKPTSTSSWSDWEAVSDTSSMPGKPPMPTESSMSGMPPKPPMPTESSMSGMPPKPPMPTESSMSGMPPKPPMPTESSMSGMPPKPPMPTESTKCSYVTAMPTSYCYQDKPDQCWSDSYTTTMYADTCTWAAWSTPVKPTMTTSGKCSYVTPMTTSKCHPEHSDWCVPVTSTSTMWADTCTWSAWSTPSKPVDETSTVTWSSWSNVPTPADETSTVTWSTWTGSKPVKETSTTSASWSVVTSLVTPGWTSNGWFGPAWATATAGQCVSEIVTSYGAPIWKPTPVLETSTTSATTWATYSASSASSTGHAPIAPAGNKWSMTYSPYNAAGVCKAKDDIKTDLTGISTLGFTTVRIYSTDCYLLEVVEEVYADCGLKVILGVFIDSTGVSGCDEQVKDIIAWAKWEMVELIVIGNEAVFQGYCSASELVSFISDCKSKFAAAGYTGSCTTTEPLAQWQSYGDQFCGVVDVVAANLYAFFNSDCTAENAGTFIASEITLLEGICPKKDVYVMECGWPSEGSCNGAACPGVDQQAVAIKAIQEECGEQIVFFSFEDETWKQPGQFGVEQHWGCADVFGKVNATVPASATTTTWASWSAIATSTSTTSTWAAWSTV